MSRLQTLNFSQRTNLLTFTTNVFSQFFASKAAVLVRAKPDIKLHDADPLLKVVESAPEV